MKSSIASFVTALILALSFTPPACAVDVAVDDIIAVQDNRVVKIDHETKAVTILSSADLLLSDMRDLAVFRGPDGSTRVYVAGIKTVSGYGYGTLYAYDLATDHFECVLNETADGLADTATFTGVGVENDGSAIVTCWNCMGEGQHRILRVPTESTYRDMSYSVVSDTSLLYTEVRGLDVGPGGYIYVACRTPPAMLASVIKVDPDTGDAVRLSYSPGGDDMEMCASKDIHVSKDGRIFVLDERSRTDMDELRIIEVDPTTGAQTMRNDSAWVDRSSYRGISIDSTGRYVYFYDGKVSNTGKEGISFLDLEGTLDPDGEFYRQSFLSLGGMDQGLDIVTEPRECSGVTLASSSAHVDKNGGTVNVSVTAPDPRARCYWSVERKVGWITPSVDVGYGSSQLTLTIQASQETQARSSPVTIGDKTFTVTQDAGELVVLEGTPISIGRSVDLDLQAQEQTYYTFVAPAEKETLSVVLSDLTTDADLYLRYGAHASPTEYVWDCRPYLVGTQEEICTVELPSPGTWGVLVDSWTGVAGVGSLTVSVSPAGTNIVGPLMLLLQ